MAVPRSSYDAARDAIAAFCRRWGVAAFALFGSVLRPDFRDDSDIDVLLTHVANM
jgi:predicted nucleotidyltransferase